MPKGVCDRDSPRKERSIPPLKELETIFSSPENTATYLMEKEIIPDRTEIIAITVFSKVPSTFLVLFISYFGTTINSTSRIQLER